METEAGVTVETESPPADRPLQNTLAEFNRKMGKVEAIEQKLNVLTDYLAQQEAAKAKPVVEPPKGSHQAMNDQELFAAAQAGDMTAFEAWNERKAETTYRRLRGQESHQNLVEGQLDIIQRKYPFLSNPQHALTQTANAAYTLLTRRGYAPNQTTYLEAVKTAITDRPDLVAEEYTKGTRAREGARRVSADNSGVMGATVRQDDPNPEGKVRVTPEQARIAQRMNIKDPQKAIKNFLKRQETGESKFGAVASFVPDGGEF